MKRALVSLLLIALPVLGGAAVVLSPQPVLATALNADECVDIGITIFPGIGKGTCTGPNEVQNKGYPGGAIAAVLEQVLMLLGSAIGGVVVLMLVIAGIQYMTSLGNPDGIKAAKKRISNAITALILFLLMAAIVNFLIPGGLL